MKITITVDKAGVSVRKSETGSGIIETLLAANADAQSIQEVAALVAKTVGIAVAQAITAITGGE